MAWTEADVGLGVVHGRWQFKTTTPHGGGHARTFVCDAHWLDLARIACSWASAEGGTRTKARSLLPPTLVGTASA